MKTLYLLRHAKASWKDESLQDVDRPLKKKGHYQAETLSAHLGSLIPPPQSIWCSPALRTRQTLEHFLGVWPVGNEHVHFHEDLYLAGYDRLLKAVQEVPDEQDVVLFVGHNPGITDLLHTLDDSASGPVSHMHTGEFVQLDFHVGAWAEVTAGSGQLKLNLRSKDLTPS